MESLFAIANPYHATPQFAPAINEHAMRNAFMRMESSRFDFSTLEHIEFLSTLLADCFPSPMRALVGVTELMINALEYGVLGITPQEKAMWVRSNSWRNEIRARQYAMNPGYQSAYVIFTRRQEGCYISVRDPGAGFKWQEHISFDPERSGALSGRGIAQAVASFDRLAYNKEGNEVVGFKAIEETLKW